MMMRREDGSALVATVLVMMVAVVVGAAMVQVSLHTDESTTLDRLRLQSLQAAEAGVNAAMTRLQLNNACDAAVSAPQVLNDGSRVLARYQTRVDAEVGTLCDTPNRVVVAWGFAPSSSGRSMRRLEVAVKLIPQDGFQFTLFASGPSGVVTVKNTGTIDGDIYAESLDQSQNNVDASDVITPGSIDTKDNASYSGSLWAGGNVTLRQNGHVGESITAAGSTAAGGVLLENGAHIARDVKAKGAVTLPTTYTIGGSVSQGNPSLPAPPQLSKPSFIWNPANYSPAPIVYPAAAQLSTYLNANRSALQGTHYVSEAGTVVDFTKGGTVTGPLTIVTNGKVRVGGSLTDSGGPWQVVIVSLATGDDAISMDKPTTASPGLNVLLYAEGGVEIKNHSSFTGSVYADRIELKNKLTITRSASLASDPPAGFDFTQASASRFTVVPALWREIVPGAPPS